MIQAEMNNDLRIWKNELLKKYRFNKFESLKKTKTMIFKFDDKLIFNQYLFKKINLLHDVEIANKNIMINYFWNKLNVKLTLTIPLKENENTLENLDKLKNCWKNFQFKKSKTNLKLKKSKKRKKNDVCQKIIKTSRRRWLNSLQINR